MLKQAMAIVLAASLAVQPARADVPPREPAKQEQRFCKGDIVTGMFIGAMIVLILEYAALKYYEPTVMEGLEKMRKEHEELKAKAERCS